MCVARRWLLALGALVLTGCDGGTEPDTIDDPGRMTFTYQALGSTGTVDVSGMPSFGADGGLENREFAFAVQELRTAGEGGAGFAIPLFILAAQPATGDEAHYLEMGLTSRSTGTFTIRDNCEVGQPGCAFVWVRLAGIGPLDSEGVELTTGSVQVTRLSKERVRGTFSGTGQLVFRDPTTGGERVEPFTVRNGTFDLNVWTEADLREAGAELSRRAATPMLNRN